MATLLVACAVMLTWVVIERPSDDGMVVEDTRAGDGGDGRNGRSGSTVDPASPGEALDPLWHQVDESAVTPLPFYAEEWSKQGRMLVRLPTAAAEASAWRVGGRLAVPLPQLETTYVAVIQEIDDGPGLSRAAVAAIPGQERELRVVVTVGPASAFAYIDTPEGPYELVAGGEFGWLLPAASMRAGFDYSRSDVIPPDAVAEEPGAR